MVIFFFVSVRTRYQACSSVASSGPKMIQTKATGRGNVFGGVYFSGPGPLARVTTLLRGTIVGGTYGKHKNLYI